MASGALPAVGPKKSNYCTAGLLALGLHPAALAGLKKGDERKVALAAAIRARPCVPNAWIARELHLWHVSRVSRGIAQAAPEIVRQLDVCLEK